MNEMKLIGLSKDNKSVKNIEIFKLQELTFMDIFKSYKQGNTSKILFILQTIIKFSFLVDISLSLRSQKVFVLTINISRDALYLYFKSN